MKKITKGILNLFVIIVSCLVILVSCSSGNSSKLEMTDEVKKEAKELICKTEGVYTINVALMQVNSLEDMSKIEAQDFFDNQAEMLDNAIEESKDFSNKIDKNTEEYKALELLEDASICLWSSYEDMIKYIDSGNYEDYKSAKTNIEVSASTYKEYVSKYKDKFNPSKEDVKDESKNEEATKEIKSTVAESKENVEKGDEEDNSTKGNKTTNETDNESVSPKTTTTTSKSSNESSITKNTTETTEKVIHDCWRCGKKNVTNYDEHWLCDDCYLEKIAHEEEDYVEEEPVYEEEELYCKGCGKRMYDDNNGTYACDDCLNISK